MKKNVFSTFATACLATLFLGASAAGQAAEPLHIGWVYAMANAPALIADKKGFYAAEGLNVDVKPFSDGPLLQQAIAAGQLDIAYVGAPPVYQWYSRGLDSRIIAKVNYGQAAVIANRDSTIRTVADLRGRKIAGVNKGSGMDVLLRGYVLKENGRLDPDKDLNIVSMPPANMDAALAHHVVDAAFTWEPFVSQSVLRGDGRVVLDINQALPQYPWYVIAATPKALKEHPADIAKLLRAHRKAIEFLNTHADEANRIIAEAFKLEPVVTADGKTLPPDAIVKEARKRLGWSAELTPGDLRFIQRLMDDSLALGFMSKPLRADQVVDATYLQHAGEQAVR